jgi:hypothetical protein
MGEKMRIGGIGLIVLIAGAPSLALAQTSFTPLPPVPAMQPLYPSGSSSREVPRRAEPIDYIARPVAAARPAPAMVGLTPPTFAPVTSAPPAQAPVLASRAELPRPDAFLPANTEVVLRLDEEVNSDGRKAGAVFRMTVARDVVFGGGVAIPRGTPAYGKVTWRTGKGAFGKSGKIAIAVDRLDLNGRSVPLAGEFREEGRGRTGATIGMAVAAGVVAAAFVSGHDAAFHAGREFRVTTREPVAVDLPVRAFTPQLQTQHTVAAGS